MTKKLTQSEEPQLAMELDLDSFLTASHLSSDSGSGSDSDAGPTSSSVPRRTIDEILNDTDSSSASASSSPRSTSALSHFLASSDPKPPQSDASVRTEASAPARLSQVEEKAVRPGLNLYNRARSADLTDDSAGRVSRPSPWLLGGARTSAKPGAALAAAAAASRSMPTPHAAAIKLRRSSAGSGRFQKAVEAAELGGRSEGGSGFNEESNGVGSETTAFDSVRSNEVEESFGGELGRKDEVLERGSEVEEVSHAGAEVSGGNAGAEEVSTVIVDENSANLDGNGIKDDELDANVEVAVESQPELDEKSPSSKHSDVEDEQDEQHFGVNSGNDVIVDNDDGKDGVDDTFDDEDDALGTSINQLVEERMEQLESRRISKKAEKKLRKPLEIAEELEKKQASTALDWEEGAAAQPMRLEGVRRGSTTLGYFNVDAKNTITRTLSSPALRRDHGSPQVLGVHSNYIAIGMSRGVVIVVPSRYSPYNADNMDAKLLFLGLQGERSYAAVSSVSFNQQGDLLLAGYADGHITVWDVQRASAAKVITGEHTAPVVHTFFLGQDSQVTRNFKAVTGDSKGLVLLHSFSVVPLLNRFSVKTQCLLDGQKTGTTLSASPLVIDELGGSSSLSSQGSATGSGSSIGGMMGGVVGGDAGWKLFNEGSSLLEEGVVVFVTHQNALVVRLTPTLHVYAQLSKPDGVREGSMPCTAWKCTTQLHNSLTNSENMPTEAVERVSLLAMAWDRKVQVARLVKSELKLYGKWSLESAAIGVAWLDDQMLVVLTITGQLCLFAKDGTVIHQTSFSLDGFGGDDLISYHTHFINVFGNPEKAYNNCIGVRGASVYVLGPTHLIVSRLLPWKERIEVLRRAGDWMGSLNMAMTIYDGQAHGVVDLPRTLDAVQEAIMPYLVELLLSYVEEVFSYISVAFCNQIGKMDQVDDLNRQSSSVHTEIKEQYTRVGGVAVEFCVHIKRTDILFDEIFLKFVAVQQRDTFLELLEPYILKDMLGSLPPEIMQALVEHYSHKGWLQRVEQCVLHMDISSLDFNQVVRLCREHGLYSALVYLFNKGLNDFRSPLEELLVVLRNSQKEGAIALGYRMLVYLKYCFSGLAFPPGQGKIHPSRLPSLRTELLQFLLEGSDAPNSRPLSSIFPGEYLNLYYLLELDTEATLDVLRCAFTEDEILKSVSSSQYSTDAVTELQYGDNSMSQSQDALVQNTIDTLIHIISMDVPQNDGSVSSVDPGSVVEWPSKKDIDHLFEFIAFYVACGKANVSRTVLSQILEYLTSENNFPPSSVSGDGMTSKRREKQVLGLLEVVPETDWNSSSVLQLCEKAQFYQVCGLIHTSRHQYIAALDCYMKDAAEPIHAFAFINKTLVQLTDDECAAFRSAVISRIPELFNLDREGALFLVMDHFSEEGSHILSELRAHPKSLFLYLKTVIEVHLSGTLDFSSLRNDNLMRVQDQTKGAQAFLERVSNFPQLLRESPINVTDDMIELYLELLCQFEHKSVLKFLETFDSYRVEHCLRLCQKYAIIDASSFLLERVGDVGSALLLTLSTLNDKFIKLENAVGSLGSSGTSRGSSSTEYLRNALKVEEVSDIESILHACIGLCQRNTHRLNPDESEALWFRLLDSFCEPLMDSFTAGTVSKGEDPNRMVTNSLDSQEDEMNSIIKWRIPKPHKCFDVLRKLFSRFIKEIVEGMIGYVRLPTIMSKLLSDNGSQEFGDFKFTILGMLSTYGFERRILDTAKSLIEDDTFYTMSVLKKGASHGYAPRNRKCCICDCLLDKNSSSYIRIFNCGHATHLKCEVSESETSSRSSSSGCPVCMPKKKSQRSKNKSVLAEESLVNEFSSRTQHTHGAIVHLHESNASENIQQISRFEMLTNLQKHSGLVEIENMPQLRLAPPAVYHEKVQHGPVLSPGESSSDLARTVKQSKIKHLREVKLKGSSLRFPLKTNLFGNGKDKISRR